MQVIDNQVLLTKKYSESYIDEPGSQVSADYFMILISFGNTFALPSQTNDLVIDSTRINTNNPDRPKCEFCFGERLDVGRERRGKSIA